MSLFKRKPKPVGIKNNSSFEKRKWIGAILVVLSLIIAFGIVPFINGQKAATVKIVVAMTDIKQGTQITSDQIKLIERGTYGLKGYMTKEKDVVGKTASVDIYKNDAITSTKVGMKNVSKLQSILNDKKSLTTISVKSNAAGVASHLEPGDKVRIYTVLDDGYGEVATFQNPLLDGIEVFDIENSNTQSLNSEKDKKDDLSGAKEMIASTITFITVSKEQENALVQAEYKGKIHVALVGR